MNRIRLATESEIAAIKDTSDLDAGCYVIALNTQQGVPVAVVRQATEVNPVHFPAGMTTKLKLLFMRDVETSLWSRGVSHYYLQIPADDKEYIDAMRDTFKAEQVSPAPELKFKKIIEP